MSGWKKLAAASAASEGVNVDTVFSSTLYNATDNGSTTFVNSGTDLSTNGGMIWFKCRSSGFDHAICDTVTGIQNNLVPNDSDAQDTNGDSLGSRVCDSVQTNGFTYGTGHTGSNGASQAEYVAFSFAKQPKFFDIVSYTGNGNNGRTISHNLGCTVGCIAVKRLDSSANWMVYHRGVNQGVNPHNFTLFFNNTVSQSDQTVWNDTAPTSSDFTVSNDSRLNASGGTYVAYIWAHNNNDGGFGASSDQDIIKCGYYEGNGNYNGPEIDLGFEPQWLMIKNTEATGNWYLFDHMRGLTAKGAKDSHLLVNELDVENSNNEWVRVKSNGFQLNATSSGVNSDSRDYIYIAIRRPMAIPTSGADVFDAVSQTPNTNYTGTKVTSDTGRVDFVNSKVRNRTGINDWGLWDRLRWKSRLVTNNINAENDFGSTYNMFLDYGDGLNDNFYYPQGSVTNPVIYHMFKRASNFFDIVCYTGTGSTRTVSHGLGKTPEMIWIKDRDGSSYNWVVYHSAISPTNKVYLSSSAAQSSASSEFASTAPTSSVFTLGSSAEVNASNSDFVAYLWCSLDGISKCGSYTGDGTTNGSKVIDCGFTNGARYVMVRNYSNGGDWAVFDTTRGINSGTDPAMFLNGTTAENSGFDVIDPHSSGFAVNDNGGTYINENGHQYLFYAVAT